MRLFKNEQNGKQVQVEFKGDMNKILEFISNYKGENVTWDLFNQEFVTSMKPTGVFIEC